MHESPFGGSAENPFRGGADNEVADEGIAKRCISVAKLDRMRWPSLSGNHFVMFGSTVCHIRRSRSDKGISPPAARSVSSKRVRRWRMVSKSGVPLGRGGVIPPSPNRLDWASKLMA